MGYPRLLGVVGLLPVLTGLTGLTGATARAQDSPGSQFFRSNGARIHYIEPGSGEPVVLLHGNTGSLEQWLESGVFQDLAQDYRAIAFDARAHGKSDKPHDPSAYGLEVALDILRLLDHLEIERAHIIGYSMGARVVGSFMISHPERFLRAILGGFAPAWNWSAEDQQGVESRASSMRTNPSPRLVEGGQDAEALAMNLLGFSELAVADRDLVAVKIPTLALVGSEDRNLERVMTLHTLMPAMKVVIIEGATHSGAFHRREFIAEVRSFVAEHGVGN